MVFDKMILYMLMRFFFIQLFLAPVCISDIYDNQHNLNIEAAEHCF